MKKFISLVLFGITVTCVIFGINAYQQNDCRKFTDEEIKGNIHNYVNIVFGEKVPTIQDLRNLEGDEAVIENEESFEKEECKNKRWAIESPECISFMRKRLDNMNRVPSYYYNFLRNLIKKEDKDLIIHEIHRPEQKVEEIKIVLVDASIGKINLQFYHAGDTCGVPLGLVSLSKINGRPIPEILQQSGQM